MKNNIAINKTSTFILILLFFSTITSCTTEEEGEAKYEENKERPKKGVDTKKHQLSPKIPIFPVKP